MEWSRLETNGESLENAFEQLCCLLFEQYGAERFTNMTKRFHRYRGAGGDGGVEAVWEIEGKDYSAVQAKWFPNAMRDSQINQVKSSVETAMRLHPDLKEYCVCIPHDLSGPSARRGKCEEERWNDLVHELSERFPGLDLQFWGDHKLTKLLMDENAYGIFAFYFQNRAISRKTFLEALEYQEAGWIHHRYLPDLHLKGEIQNQLNRLSMPAYVRSRIIREISDYIMLIEQINERLDFFIQLEGKVKQSLVENAKLLKENGILFANELQTIRSAHISDVLSPKLSGFHAFITSAQEFVYAADEIEYGTLCYSSTNKLARYIKMVLFEGVSACSNPKCFRYPDKARIIIMADAGTGKTHAFCSEALSLASSNYALPILFKASDLNAGDGWTHVIASSLRIGNIFSNEKQLFSALDVAASYLDHLDEETGLEVRGKIIVLIDGIDESRERERWYELIGEAESISEKHPRIRFGFSSRPSVFRAESAQAFSEDLFHMYEDGDVRVEDIIEKYLKEYNITLDQDAPVRRIILTPLELKLFCLVNRNRDLGAGPSYTGGLLGLIDAQLDNLEIEVSKKARCSSKQQPVRKILATCSDLLFKRESITYDDLAAASSISAFADTGVLDCALNVLTEYGILSSRLIKGETPFEPCVFTYTSGFQIYFDYMVATMLLSSLEDKQTSILSEHMENYYEALQFAAIISFEEDGFLMTDNPSFSRFFSAENREELAFICTVLRNVDPAKTDSIKKRVLEWMSLSSTDLILVVNELICHVASNKDHPLGARLLDEYLSSFKSPAIRDIVWSLPACVEMRKDNLEIWHDGIVDEKYLSLTEFDDALGRPLIVAWHLSTLDSNRRELCENSLAQWASIRPDDFSDLLVHFAYIDDPQIVESLFSVAAFLSFSSNCTKSAINSMADLADQRVFESAQESNASVRHHARMIMEQAYERGLLAEEQLEKYRPPYLSSDDALPLNEIGMEGENNGGPAPMDYDRSRYVVCDPVQNRFFRRWGNEKVDEQKEFLEGQAKRLGVSEMDAAQFCHCAVQGCLSQWGWDNGIHHFFEAGSPDPKSFGIDIAITRRYHSSSHGQRSNIVSIGEKYIWTAKNRIMGYLADRLPFREIGNERRGYLDDYLLLDSYRVPFDPSACNPRQVYDSEVSIPSQLMVSRSAIGVDCEKIEAWISDDEVPFDINELLLGLLFSDRPFEFSAIDLDLFFHIEQWGASETVWVASCAIPSDMVSSCVKELVSNQGFAAKFFHVDQFSSYVESACYVTPQEICSNRWREELYSFVGDISDENESINNILMYKGQVECVANVHGKGDIYFTIPSKLFREYLNVESCDGRHGFDRNGRVVFEYRNVGGIGDEVVRTALSVDKDKLFDGLKEAGMELCWFMRILKETGSECFDHRECEHRETDRLYFVYGHLGELRMLPIDNQEIET